MSKTLGLGFIGIVIVLSGYTQSLTSTNKKAIKLYNEANLLAHNRQFDEAIARYETAIKKDPDFAEAYWKLGSVYSAYGKSQIANRYYKKVADLAPHSPKFAGVLFQLGKFEFYQGEYLSAQKYLNQYLGLKKEKDKYSSKASQMLKNCHYALKNMEHGYQFNPRPLDATVNRFRQQYFPVLTVDQQTLFFIRRNKDEDIMVSNRLENGKWTEPSPISSITSPFNEGTCSISGDGRMLVFTSCMGRKGFGSCDLYVTYKEGNVWSEPENLGRPVNSTSWDSQPSLSPDGRTLYFVSDRKGGLGRRDIWVTHIDPEGEWDIPKNLGAPVNTAGDDISPFIHPNGQRLYFASDHYTGFGGFDIFFSDKKSGKWSSPENFGYPINTQADEVAMFITADGKHGYYSHESGSKQNKVSLIYHIDIPASLQVALESGFIAGRIFDSENHEPLGAKVQLFDVGTEELVSQVQSDSINGKYVIVLTEGKEYALHVNRKGYLFRSYHFDYSKGQQKGDSLRADIGLTPIAAGVSTTLNNIFFDFDKSSLNERSVAELKLVISFLKAHSGMKVEIGGYTDNIGDDMYNQHLSLERARSVYKYLVNNGIDKNQLTFKGYGSRFSLNNNATEAERSQNRRIEFKVLNSQQ